MKLGFVSAILADCSFEEVVTFASEQNFESVEFMCWPQGMAERRYAGVTHIDVNGLSPGKIDYIKGLLKDQNIEASALGYYPNPLDSDLHRREVFIGHIQNVIRAASTLGIGRINTFIGRMQFSNVQENLEEAKKVWAPIAEFAESLGVKIGIENCPMFFSKDEWPAGQNIAYSPAIWEQLFTMIPSNSLGLNYDPSHLLWQQMDYIRPIYEFKDRIFHVHIKDVALYKEKLDRVGILAMPLEYHTPKLPGLGDIQWGKFLAALMDIHFAGHAAIEVEDRAFEDSLVSRQRAIRQSRDYIRQFLAK